MKRLILAVMATLGLMSCNCGKKVLVLYYSQTGTTKAVAEEIASQLGADVCSFDVAEVYDGDFDATIERCLKEMKEGYVPELAPLSVDLSSYDVIFLGYPIWFGTYAPPVKALISSFGEVLGSKTIVPFCTFGSGGLESSVEDLVEALPSADVREGYGVRTARVSAAAGELSYFLVSNGWKEGSVEELPPFSDSEAVSEAEAAVFDEACAGYPYPMGVPVSVASRPIDGGTEYLFVAEGRGRDGGVVESKVYVIAVEGAKAEFTKVVR